MEDARIKAAEKSRELTYKNRYPDFTFGVAPNQFQNSVKQWDLMVEINILLDLDRFRVINETLGPSAGDSILKEVSRRLSTQVREGDTIGRRAGNEFGFVMANLGHERDVMALAQRMQDAVTTPIQIGTQSLSLTASIGISLAPGHVNQTRHRDSIADVAQACQLFL